VFDSQTFLLTPEKVYETQNKQKLYEILSQRVLTIAGLFSVDYEDFSQMRLYMCIQSLMKFHPSFDDALVRILSLDPAGLILLLRNDAMITWQNKFSSRLYRRLEKAGINPTRVVFVPQMNSKEYQFMICQASVNLDPFPFGTFAPALCTHTFQ
jgi:sulfur relay (sulfurtransferase) DsrF/TusC family protein